MTNKCVALRLQVIRNTSKQIDKRLVKKSKLTHKIVEEIQL